MPTDEAPPATDRPSARNRRREAEIARRRRNALMLVAAGAAVVGLIVGATAGGDDEDKPAAVAAAPACPEAISGDADRLVGQALLVRMEDRPTPALLERARRGELGGVILFPSADVSESTLRKGVEELADAAQVGGFPAPIVAIDQEGGEVKRLADAPPDLAPSEIAKDGAPTATEQGRLTGQALADLGINLDLAPVLDIASSPTGFINSRTFGDDPASVTEIGGAFAAGLDEAGVAAAGKHFPGLGEASVNSDLETSTVEADEAALAAALEPFTAAIDAGIAVVMTANATYPGYDAKLPASLSPAVGIGLLREELGFEGVVVTDDLGAGAITGAGFDEGEAAVFASRAGADLLLFALSDGSAAAKALKQALARGKLDRERLLTSCARVADLRERYDLAAG